MAAVIIVLIFIVLIGLGTRGIAQIFTGKKVPKNAENSPSPDEVADPATTTVPHDIAVFLKALANEGYMGRVRVEEDRLVVVDNPVLSDMLTTLAQRYDLEWVLPIYGLRVRILREGEFRTLRNYPYSRAVLTRTHVIGYNPTQV